MDQTTLIALPAVGAAVGGSLAWALVRGRTTSAVARALQAAQQDTDAVHAELRLETERRARAEQDAARVGTLEQELAARMGELQELGVQRAKLQTLLDSERERLEQERELISQMQQQMHERFRALSADALKANTEQFLTLAKTSMEKHQEGAKADLAKRQVAIEQLVRPMQDSLRKVETQFGEIEKARVSTHAALLQQVSSLETTASTLATALRAPKARGRWGELQLRRVVELAGMVDRCDFVEQTSTSGEHGRLMPDMVVNLPGGKTIVVDAKTPMDSYLSAVEAPDEDRRRELLAEHAARVRQHVTDLSRKEYWKQFASSPEFVVLFLPGEDLFSAALEFEPALIELGAEHRVMLTTPTSLIAMLRAVAHGWREQALAENARVIRDLGRDLYERAAVIAEKWNMLGKHLGKAVGSYNESVASMESRFLVTARKFQDLDVPSAKDVPELIAVETVVRELAADELVQPETITAPALVVTNPAI